MCCVDIHIQLEISNFQPVDGAQTCQNAALNFQVFHLHLLFILWGEI